MSSSPKKQPDHSFLKYSGMAFQMLAIIGLGIFFGMKLDDWLGLKEIPVFSLLMVLVSTAAALYLTLKDFVKRK